MGGDDGQVYPSLGRQTAKGAGDRAGLDDGLPVERGVRDQFPDLLHGTALHLFDLIFLVDVCRPMHGYHGQIDHMTDIEGRPELLGHADGLDDRRVGIVGKVRRAEDTTKIDFHASPPCWVESLRNGLAG